MATLLLDRGASVTEEETACETAIAMAAWNGHLEMVALLVDRGAPLGSSTDKYGPVALLLQAAAAGHALLARRLLDRGVVAVDARRKETYHGTALQRATEKGHLEMVTLLLDRGALPDGPGLLDEPTQRGLKGETALQRAARYDHLEIVKLLLTRGASVDTRAWILHGSRADDDRKPMLHWATEKHHFEVVKLLVELGASLDATDEDGDTALALALRKHHRATEYDTHLGRKAIWRNICILLMRALGVAGDRCTMLLQDEDRPGYDAASILPIEVEEEEGDSRLISQGGRHFTIRSTMATLRSDFNLVFSPARRSSEEDDD